MTILDQVALILNADFCLKKLNEAEEILAKIWEKTYHTPFDVSMYVPFNDPILIVIWIRIDGYIYTQHINVYI